jgi:hypothetical protein
MKKLFLWIIAIILLIQLIKMDVPATLSTENYDEIVAPKEIMRILKRSCYDCHSNTLLYPWYSKIAPMSWYTKLHVRNGRKAVNFSIWNSYDKKKQFKVMDKLPHSLHIRMPLPDYLWLHEEAKLSKNDKKLLREWAKSLSVNLN